MPKGKYTKGFTLVELLVVIAIIAILAGALFLVINPAKLMAKTRDSKRIGELASVNKAIANALADGKITLGTFGANTADTATGVLGGNGWVRFGLVGSSNGLQDYMTILPRDPLRGGRVNNVTFYYRFASTTDAWELNALMESEDSNTQAQNDGGNANTCGADPLVSCVYEIGTDPDLDLMGNY